MIFLNIQLGLEKSGKKLEYIIKITRKLTIETLRLRDQRRRPDRDHLPDLRRRFPDSPVPKAVLELDDPVLHHHDGEQQTRPDGRKAVVCVEGCMRGVGVGF